MILLKISLFLTWLDTMMERIPEAVMVAVVIMTFAAIAVLVLYIKRGSLVQDYEKGEL